MNKTTRLALGIAVIAAVVTAAVLLLPIAHAGSKPTYEQEIYRITTSWTGVDGKKTSVPTWVSLATGTWRMQSDGLTIISSKDAYVTTDKVTGSVYRRTGSSSFIGNLHDAPAGVVALRAYLKGDTSIAKQGLSIRVGTDQHGKKVLTEQDKLGHAIAEVTIEREISDQEALKSSLFDTAPANAHEIDSEVAVGKKPSSGMTAYWFGPEVRNLYAAKSIEHSRVRSSTQTQAGISKRSEVQAHVVIYELNSYRAKNGRPSLTAAQPGVSSRPEGELQVNSEPVGFDHAKSEIGAFNGKNGDETYPAWPRSRVTLANGETATLIPSLFDGAGPTRSGFFVITKTTLISVSGEIALRDIPILAASLRPLG
jgi:hypothetical protein